MILYFQSGITKRWTGRRNMTARLSKNLQTEISTKNGTTTLDNILKAGGSPKRPPNPPPPPAMQRASEHENISLPHPLGRTRTAAGQTPEAYSTEGTGTEDNGKRQTEEKPKDPDKEPSGVTEDKGGNERQQHGGVGTSRSGRPKSDEVEDVLLSSDEEDTNGKGSGNLGGKAAKSAQGGREGIHHPGSSKRTLPNRNLTLRTAAGRGHARPQRTDEAEGSTSLPALTLQTQAKRALQRKTDVHRAHKELQTTPTTTRHIFRMR